MEIGTWTLDTCCVLSMKIAMLNWNFPSLMFHTFPFGQRLYLRPWLPVSWTSRWWTCHNRISSADAERCTVLTGSLPRSGCDTPFGRMWHEEQMRVGKELRLEDLMKEEVICLQPGSVWWQRGIHHYNIFKNPFRLALFMFTRSILWWRLFSALLCSLWRHVRLRG